MGEIAGLGDWLQRKVRRSWRSVPKETEPSGNFDTKIALSNLETLRIGYKCLPDSHSCKLPVLPKCRLLWASAPCGGLILLLYTPPISLQQHPVWMPFSILNKTLPSWGSSQSPPSHSCLPDPASLTPDPSPGGHVLGRAREDSSSPPTEGPAQGASLTGENLHFPHVLPNVLLKHYFFSCINAPCIVKTLSLCLS